MHFERGSKEPRLSCDKPTNDSSSPQQSVFEQLSTPEAEKKLGCSTEELSMCDSANLSEGLFLLNSQSSLEISNTKDEMLQELTKLINEIDEMLIGDIKSTNEEPTKPSFESLCAKYKRLANEFESKYRTIKLQNASLELSVLYAERDNFKKNKSLEELQEEDKLIKLSEERKANLADIKELSAQNLRLVDILSNLRTSLGKIEARLRSNATKAISVSAKEVYEKLRAVTESLSNSVEQNKILHRALKAAKNRILLQNTQLTAYKNLLDNPSYQNELKKKVEDLERELQETRIMARKEQELMMTALSTMYDRLIANKISGKDTRA